MLVRFSDQDKKTYLNDKIMSTTVINSNGLIHSFVYTLNLSIKNTLS